MEYLIEDESVTVSLETGKDCCCCECGLDAGITDKFIFAVCLFTTARCTKPHTMMYYLREVDSRYGHEDVNHDKEVSRVMVIKAPSNSDEYIAAVENSYMVVTGKMWDEDTDSFTEWRKNNT